jgi:hypothetical protein
MYINTAEDCRQTSANPRVLILGRTTHIVYLNPTFHSQIGIISTEGVVKGLGIKIGFSSSFEFQVQTLCRKTS